MKTKIKLMKCEQKERAQEIKSLKSKRKELKGYVPGLDSEQFRFRVNHIAYCLIRGRAPEEIENRWKECKLQEKEYAWKQAYSLVEEIKEAHNEAICVDSE